MPTRSGDTTALRSTDAHRRLDESPTHDQPQFRTGNHTAERTPVAIQMNNRPDGFFALDAAGALSFADGSAEQVFGKRCEDLVGHNVQRLFPRALVEPFTRVYKRVLADGTPATFEAFYAAVDMQIEMRLYPTAGGVAVYLHDSASRRHLEEDLEHALAREKAAHHEAERRRGEAEAASQRLLQLHEVTDVALSHLALADLAPAVLERICSLMAVDTAAILLLTEDRRALTVHAGRGAFNQRVRIPLGRGIAGRIAASRQPLIADDLSTIEVVQPSLRDNLCAVAGVPLLVEGRCIGVLQVGSATPRLFAEPDVRLLQLVGDRIALTIDHVQLYEMAKAGYAEAEARASELEATFATMTDGVFVADRQGNRVRINQAFRRLMGLEQSSDSVGISPSERSVLFDIRDAKGQPVPPERLPAARILHGEVLEGASAMDLTLRALDGREVEANVTGAPVRTTEDGIVGAVAVYRNVTEQRNLERRSWETLQALLNVAEAIVKPDSTAETSSALVANTVIRRFAELARSLLDCQRISFMVLDPETEQLQLLFGLGLTPQAKRHWKAQARRRMGDFLPTALIERLQAGDVVVGDSTAIAPASRQPHEAGQSLLAPLRSGSKLMGLLAIDYGNDPHQFTQRENTIAGMVAQLCSAVFERERLVREREAAYQSEIASREATKRMEIFMAMASHEFRTPLTVIKGYLHLAERYLGLRQPDGEIAAPLARALQATRESVALAQQASARLTGLLDDLLQVSSAQTGKLRVDTQPCDLITIVRDTVSEQRRVNPTRQLRLRLPAKRRPPVNAHPERIAQVVTNYLTNALKYSAADQPVEVRVQMLRQFARVSVRDRGPGIRAEDQKAVWEGFYQTPGVERQAGPNAGLGLGLYICRTIIEQHGGRVGVDSSVGRGSAFWFTLPLSTYALRSHPEPLHSNEVQSS